MSFHRAVTFAGCLFQVLPIENRDVPVGVFDEPGLLESTRHKCDRGPR